MRCLATLIIVAAVTGCVNELPSPQGERVTGRELTELITGATIHGRYSNNQQNFVERYHPDGRYDIAFARDRSSEKYSKKHTGTWRIEGNKVCYKVASLDSDGCADIYNWYSQIEFVSPKTGKVAFYSSEIEYERKKPPSIAAVPSPPAPIPPTPPTAPKPPKNLQLHASGSGFIISNQTFVLTNNHVIKGCTEITVRIDDRDIRADTRARDERNDLALLRLPAGKYPAVAFRGNDGLYPGDSVIAIGYPLSDILASEGNVSVGIVSALAGIGNDASLLQISAPIQPGNSGGPLFDSSGNVIGIIVSGLGNKFYKSEQTLAQNVNFAIKSSVAMSFMQASGVDYQTLNSAKELRNADVARKGRPATVFIKCWR